MLIEARANPRAARGDLVDNGAEMFANVYDMMQFGKKKYKADVGYPKLTREERDELADLFAAFTATYQPTFRAWEKLEWVIMHRIVEGTIGIRKHPQYLRRGCAGENLLRFQLTIKAQVDSHLHGRLSKNTPMYANHQTTKRIVDAIMLAAWHRREQDDNLVDMLRTFCQQKLRLADVNQAHTQTEKTTDKVNAFLDMGHFLVALKEKLGGGEMTAYFIDTPRACAAPPAELTKPNCIVFTQADLSQSATTKTAPFTSAEERRAAFAKPKVKPKATGETEQPPEAPKLTTGGAND
ncbi:hypothetical protein PybrP1_001411 [[Pythium] brassicae (nom. inval.)]|nr:hypothetical protein PybrP1_001411 [[Pythium] brassicae (nom. inval.)]